MAPARSEGPVFGEPPDPGRAATMEEFITSLRLLKTCSGDPSITTITNRIHRAWAAAGRPASELPGRSTVGNCFRVDRARPSEDLVLAVVDALRPDAAVVAQWRQAFRVLRGEAGAASFVQAQARLPDDIAAFTGRERELTDLLDAGADGRAVVISAIEGMAGIGKTQLAVHAGHLLVARYGFERVLFVNLRGFHDNPHQPPADPAAVLDSFLRLLDVPGHDIPHDLDGRASLYRQQLRDRRVLIVLDNAATAQQVHPLLPDSPSCLTLITSRRTLSDLPQAEHLRLDVFTPTEALDFLRRTIGTRRVDAEPAAARGIISECGHLPLALRIAAARIQDPAKSGWSLANHHSRLVQRRTELKIDDRVQVALSLSYHDLPTGEQRLFRLLSQHPGHDIDAHAAAALADTDLDTTRRQLRRLLDEHVLHQRTPDRYEFHDLIRTYATAQATDDEPDTARRDALTRLVDHYLHTARVAMDLLYPFEQHRRPRIPPPASVTITLPDQTTARRWLDTERANLLAIATHPTHHNRPSAAVGLSATLHRHLLTTGHYADAQTLHQHAITTARQHGDHAGQAAALNYLGIVYQRLGRYEQATDHFKQALTLFRDVGDLDGQARALGNLGTVYQLIGQYQQATDHYQQALTLFRDFGHPDGQATILSNLGIVSQRIGQYQQATDHFKQALTLYRDLGNPHGQSLALTNLGIMYQRLGRYGRATDHLSQALTLCCDLGDPDGQATALASLGIVYQRLGRYERATVHLQHALTLFRDLGDLDGQAWALTYLGIVYQGLGRYERATDYHQHSLTLFRDIGDPEGQAEALNGLGETLRAAGDLARALAAHTEAHQHASTIGNCNEQARAHAGLGHTHHDLGSPGQAREYWQQALALYDELGVPEADEVRAHLAALDDR